MSILLYLLLLFQPYSRVNCSALVSFGHEKCTAAEFSVGCHGKLKNIERRNISIVTFGNRHVGVQINSNLILDSTPEHGVMIHKIPKNDPWYQDPKYWEWK